MTYLLYLISTNIVLIILIIGQIILLANKTYVLKREKQYMFIIFILAAVDSLFASIDYKLSYEAEYSFIRLLSMYIDICIKPFLILMFYYMTTKMRKWKFFLLILPFVNALLYTSCFIVEGNQSLFNLTFYINQKNQIVKGIFYYICPFFSLSIGCIIIGETIKHWKELRMYRKLMIWFIVITNIVLSVLEYKYHLNQFCVVICLSAIFYHFFLYTQYMKQHEKDIITQNQIQIMISQIQPHFLYNTLNSIYHLCDVDVELAKKTIDDFSTYLRMNLKSLSNQNPIPFRDELKHTQTYANIEKLRFGERVNVEYDIQYKDFRIPPLTLQPIVENAIKHGICEKEDGGTVLVRTFIDSEDYINIVVSDDGVGFDMTQIKDLNEPGKHVGYLNVKNKVENILKGTVTTESTIGKGTTITLRFK